MPRFHHRDFEFEIEDLCWSQAGMIGFVPADRSYVPGPPEARLGLEGRTVITIPLADIAPIRRNLSHGPFNDSITPAAERVGRILRGFLRNEPIPPVQAIRLPDGSEYTHRLYNGVHRFYCAVAVGYSHIPVIEVPSPEQ